MDKKFAIFDMDGTLVDSMGYWNRLADEYLARFGLPGLSPALKEESIALTMLESAQLFIREFGLPGTPEQIAGEINALMEEHYRTDVPLKPGAADFLRQCREEGIPMALFTACRPALCRAALERFGLADYFTAVVYAEEIGLEKRDPACFVELGRRLGADLADCTLFDDSPDNCATAARAGMTAVGVYDGYYAARQEELKTVCARYIRSFEELLWK